MESLQTFCTAGPEAGDSALLPFDSLNDGAGGHLASVDRPQPHWAPGRQRSHQWRMGITIFHARCDAKLSAAFSGYIVVVIPKKTPKKPSLSMAAICDVARLLPCPPARHLPPQTFPARHAFFTLPVFLFCILGNCNCCCGCGLRATGVGRCPAGITAALNVCLCVLPTHCPTPCP